MNDNTIESQLGGLVESRVLIVEDEAAVRTLCQRILERAGCQVDTSEDGLDGLKRFKELQNDLNLVLIDCTLPYLSGPELYKEIVQLRPDIKVIFCSGYNEDNVVPNMGQLDNCKFLHKPYKGEELTAAVAALLKEPA